MDQQLHAVASCFVRRPAHLFVLAVALCLGVSSEGAGQPAHEPSARSADPHEQLRTILSQPIYQRWKLRQQRAESNQSGSAWAAYIREKLAVMRQKIANAFSRWFRGWRGLRLPSLGDPTALLATLKLVAWIVLIGIIVLLALLAYRALRGTAFTGRRTRLLSREQVRQALDDGQALALDSTQWFEQARQLAGARDFRSVYRALYLALLSGLHKSGKIVYRRNRTNWTYVSRYTGDSDERTIFAELTGLFDEVWYGAKPARGTDLEAVRSKVTLLVAEGGPA